jgi:hypothetical protein
LHRLLAAVDGGHAINCGANADVAGMTFCGNIVSGVSGMTVYSTSSTNVYLGHVAHNLFYQVNSIATPAAFASICSARVLDNSEDNMFANPFGSGETLSAAAKSHAILLADGTTHTYPDYGAVQTQAVAAGAMLVHGGMTGGISG